LIGKVKKLTSSVENGPKVNTPGFASNSKDIESRIKNLERIICRIDNNEDSPANKNTNINLNFEIENRVKSMEKDIEDLKTTVSVGTVASNDGTTHSSMNPNLRKKLDSIFNEYQELKNSLLTCQQLVDSKADFEQLQEIDKVVTDKLND
jgi:phosphopentomutase